MLCILRFLTFFLWFIFYCSCLLQVLCLSPTRELAVQIQKVVLALGDYMNVQCHSCIGKNAYLLLSHSRVCVGLIMLAACTVLRSPFLASYWSAGFGRFLQVSALASHWLEDCANFTPTPEENDQYSASNTSINPMHFYQ